MVAQSLLKTGGMALDEQDWPFNLLDVDGRLEDILAHISSLRDHARLDKVLDRLASQRDDRLDRILDHLASLRERAGDHIDLSAVDAKTTLGGDQAFAFVGTDAFHHVAGALRYQQLNGITHVYGDTDGDSNADFLIHLDGLHSLNSSDFVI